MVDSSEGRNLAARIAEGTFAAAPDFGTALAYTTDVKARARALRRNPDHLLVTPGLSVFRRHGRRPGRRRWGGRLLGGIDHVGLGLGRYLVIPA